MICGGQIGDIAGNIGEKIGNRVGLSVLTLGLNPDMRYSAGMKLLLKIFTWWDGATIGTHLFSMRKGVRVGVDAQGNKYFKERSPARGKRERRWVIYNGPNDASRVPAEWHGWLHGSFDDVPESYLPPPRIWEAEFTPNATGTLDAHRPHRDASYRSTSKNGEYEAWSPEG